MLFLYDTLQYCLEMKAKSYDQIHFKLIESNFYWEKKLQSARIDEDDDIFSVVYSLLKIESEGSIYLISLKFLKICSK